MCIFHTWICNWIYKLFGKITLYVLIHFQSNFLTTQRENHDKNRITGEDNGCQAGIGHVDPDLEEDHAETDVDQPEDSQIAPIGTIEVNAALLQIADSQRHEQQPTDEEPEKGQLERRERRPGNLQGNFHRTKGYGRQNNT